MSTPAAPAPAATNYLCDKYSLLDLGPCVGHVGEQRGGFLEFRFHDGRRLAVPYHIIKHLQFFPDPRGEDAIAIALGAHTIAIKGQRLADVFVALADERVSWLQEVDPFQLNDSSISSLITGI